MIKVLRNIFPLDICKLIVGYLVDDTIDVKSLNYNGCDRCNEKGAFTTTPRGADFLVCPNCRAYIVTDENYINGIPDHHDMYVCDKCSMMFDTCCSHGVNGCTDDTYYARIVTGFYLDGVWFKGMPKFSSIDDIEKLIKSVEVELVVDCWSTINKRTFCPYAYYKYDKSPSLYHKTGTCSQIKMKVNNVVK